MCADVGIALPWDVIAKTMEPRDATKGEKPMTGEAIKQHLAKLRDHRDTKGFDVPPKLDRNTRRSVVGGKTALQTPASTPRKSSGFFGGPPFPKPVHGRGKAHAQAQNETPAKKESTLLAPLSKAKQKKAEKAMKAQVGNDSGDLTAATSRVGKAIGGSKATTGKRGRRPAAAVAEDEYSDDNAADGMTSGRQLRHDERKDYTGMAADFREIGIKEEPESEDDLPLSKRRNIAKKSGGRKKAAVGLMDDAVQIWEKRNAKASVDESAAKSPVVDHIVRQVISVPNNDNNQLGNFVLSHAPLGGMPSDPNFPDNVSEGQGNLALSQTTLNTVVPNETAFPFRQVDYQALGAYGQPHPQASGGSFNTQWSQFQSGYPSPMDDAFMNNQALGHPACAPGPMVLPHLPHNLLSRVENNLPLASSPDYHVPSSVAFPGFDSDNSQLESRNNSTISSFSNTQGLQDPFAANNHNGDFGGLPAPHATMGEWGGPFYQATRPTGLSTEHQYSDYTESQVSPGYANPTFTTSALGLDLSLSIPGGDTLDPPAEIKADYALPSYPYVNQPATPAFGMSGFDLDLRDPSFEMHEFVHNSLHAGQGQIASSEFDG